MTRLHSNQVASIPKTLLSYDAELIRKTGCNLRQIACRAAQVTEDDLVNFIISIQVAVVPVTSGKGVIAGFVEAVQSITAHLGCRTYITNNCDVAGLAEAIENRSDIIFLADDKRFVALDMLQRRVIDNAEATGRGYVAALDCLTGGLGEKEVLVIGAGPVGKSAIVSLKKAGAKVGLYDIDQTKAQHVAREFKVKVEKNISEAAGLYNILFDASPASQIITPEYIKPRTIVAAPGIPLGLSHEAASLVGDRLIHDPLQIGVATMLALALAGNGD